MAYKKIFSFREKMNGEGDLIKVTLTFDVNLAGDTNQEFIAEDKGIFISKYGELNWTWEIDDFLLVPGELKLNISDTELALWNLFFEENTESNAHSKRPELKIEIKYAGSTEYVEEFLGLLTDGGVEINPDSKRGIITAAVQTDKLNGAALFDENDQPANPLNYGNFGTSVPRYDFLKNIIHNIYKFVNPAIELDIKHDWLLKGMTAFPEFDGLDFVGYSVIPESAAYLNDLKFTDLQYNYNDLFFTPQSKFVSLGALLKTIAKEWGAYTGMLTHGKCFFHQMLAEHTVFNITDEILIHESDSKKVELLVGTEIGVFTGYNHTEYGRKGKRYSSYYMSSNHVGKNYFKEDLLSETMEWGGFAKPALIARIGSNHYFVNQYDGSIDKYRTDHPQRLADTLYQLRGRENYNKVKTFRLHGINYSFLHDYLWQNKLYVPFSLSKFILGGRGDYTEILCIRKEPLS